MLGKNICFGNSDIPMMGQSIYERQGRFIPFIVQYAYSEKLYYLNGIVFIVF
jgi:hypothetical protein